MHQPMKGVKMVEVAQFTFTPAAGAVLADWGADVIKVEHAVTGDAQRGLRLGTGGVAAGSFQPLMEHPNRGKRSIGLALEHPEGHAVLLELCKDADVFLTNFLPDARATAPHRGGGHPEGESEHHLRARQRPRPAGAGRRQGRVRRLDLLVPDGQRLGHHTGGQPADRQPTRRRLRRLDGRDDHRGRDRRRPLRPRAHWRALGGRRLADERRRLGLRPVAQQRGALRRGDGPCPLRLADEPRG